MWGPGSSVGILTPPWRCPTKGLEVLKALPDTVEFPNTPYMKDALEVLKALPDTPERAQ